MARAASDEDPIRPSARSTRSSRRVVIEITPWGAFAAGALVVSALALAVSWGRTVPLDSPKTDGKPIEAVQTLPVFRYDRLTVDRGSP